MLLELCISVLAISMLIVSLWLCACKVKSKGESEVSVKETVAPVTPAESPSFDKSIEYRRPATRARTVSTMPCVQFQLTSKKLSPVVTANDATQRTIAYLDIPSFRLTSLNTLNSESVSAESPPRQSVSCSSNLPASSCSSSNASVTVPTYRSQSSRIEILL